MSLNSHSDQAEGLRRMLAPRRAHRVTVLSALEPAHKNEVLLNLAAALAHTGADVLLLDACQSSVGVGASVIPPLNYDLLDLAKETEPQEHQPWGGVKGVRLLKLSHQPLSQMATQVKVLERLKQALLEAFPETGYCIVDTQLETDTPFILPELTQGDILVLTSTSPQSIKTAYAQIKAAHASLGRRSYHLLVLGAPMQQAALIHKNISQVAKLYLAVNLSPLGHIPADEHLSRSAQLLRPVIEAFPLSAAADAYRAVSARLSTV